MRTGNLLSRRRAMGLVTSAALAGLAVAGLGCGSVGGGKTLSRKARLQRNDPRQASKTLQQTRRVPGA